MLNGEFVPADKACLSARNRGLLYGEVYSMVMRACSSKVYFFENYYNKLLQELAETGIPKPALMNEKMLEHDIYLLLQKCRIYKGANVRITVFRNENESFYVTNTLGSSVIIEIEHNHCENYTLNEIGLRVAVAEFMKLPNDKLPFRVSPNALGFTQLSEYFNEYQADSFLLINKDDLLIQAPDGNVVFVAGNQALIPGFSRLYTHDVLMEPLEEALQNAGLKLLYDAEIRPRDLINVDEVYIIDSLHGIRWVQAFGEKRFYHRYAVVVNKCLVDIATKSLQLQ